MFPRLDKFDGPIFRGGLHTGGGRLIFEMLIRLYIWEAYIRGEGGGLTYGKRVNVILQYY